MRIGQKSILFGVHNFLWHPYTVLKAWWKLYGRPSFKELICIVIHDLGYWFTEDIEGGEGYRHPEFGARLAGRLFGPKYHDLVMYHSRDYAKKTGQEPSKLCWADKYSIQFEPRWFYLLRATVSGEIKEFRKKSSDARYLSLSVSDKEWFDFIKKHLSTIALRNTNNIKMIPIQRKIEGNKVIPLKN